MKIQLGSIVMNQTKKYLIPCLKHYGEEFVDKFTKMEKLAVGIGDIVLADSGIEFEKHIFFLIDARKSSQKRRAIGMDFADFLGWIREQPMYEDDYVFDHVTEGHLHMVVVKMPEEYHDTFETFKKGDFSKMYSRADLEKYFQEKPQIKKILIKEHNYRVKFVQKLNELYGSDMDVTEYEGELDFPLKEENEIFNTEIIE